MSHTASAFAKTYAGTDVTRTVEFKTAFNTTLLRVLDDKLPALISQTCVSCSLEHHYARPVADQRVH